MAGLYRPKSVALRTIGTECVGLKASCDMWLARNMLVQKRHVTDRGCRMTFYMFRLQFYLSSYTDQLSALVLPLTLRLSFRGCPPQVVCQTAGGQSWRNLAGQSLVLLVGSYHVVELPASLRWLIEIASHTCLQISTQPLRPNQPVISIPDQKGRGGLFSPVQQIVKNA